MTYLMSAFLKITDYLLFMKIDSRQANGTSGESSAFADPGPASGPLLGAPDC